MEKDITVQDIKKQIIDAIQPSDEHLTSPAGLALFAQYLQSIRLMPIIERMFASMRKNKKGIAVSDFFAQILCFFMDGSSRHLSWFDHLKRDEGYAALLSCSEQDLASSHAVKRFFGKFSLIEHNSQLSLPGLDHDGVIITNLGMGEAIDGQLSQAAEEKRINAHSILGSYHGRGKDELANRSLKNFSHQQLPSRTSFPIPHATT